MFVNSIIIIFCIFNKTFKRKFVFYIKTVDVSTDDLFKSFYVNIFVKLLNNRSLYVFLEKTIIK